MYMYMHVHVHVHVHETKEVNTPMYGRNACMIVMKRGVVGSVSMVGVIAVL